MNTPLVTVVLPAFNRLPYLRIAVHSVVHQTYPNWELVIANDGSTGQTLRYLRDLADPRIRLVSLVHSGHPSIARNAAIREARGQYVAFLDSDDAWLPQKLEIQVAALRARARCRWSYTAVEHIDGDGGPAHHRQGESWIPFEGWIAEPLLNIEAYVAMPTVLAERTLIEEAGAFDENQRFGEDYDLWVRLAIRSEVALVNERLTRVRRHAVNFSHDRRAFYAGWVTLYDKALASTTDSHLRSICQRKRLELALSLVRLHGRAGDWKRAWQTLTAASRDSRGSAAGWLGIVRAFLGAASLPGFSARPHRQRRW